MKPNRAPRRPPIRRRDRTHQAKGGGRPLGDVHRHLEIDVAGTHRGTQKPPTRGAREQPGDFGPGKAIADGRKDRADSGRKGTGGGP